MVAELEIREDNKGTFYFGIKNVHEVIPRQTMCAVNKIRKKKCEEERKIKSEAKIIKKSFDIKVQKYLFEIHYRLLERIQCYAGGLIFSEHFECFLGQSYAELQKHLDIMNRLGLLSLVKIHNQSLIQLKTFSTTRLKSHDKKSPTLAPITILKNAYCGEILSSILSKFPDEHKYFLNYIENRSTFFNNNREADYSGKWAKLEKLKRRDCYILFNEEQELEVYFLDLYNTTKVSRIGARICNILQYLHEEKLFMFVSDEDGRQCNFNKVIIKMCVQDEARKKELKSFSTIIEAHRLKKNLLFAYDIEIHSYDLTGKFFA